MQSKSVCKYTKNCIPLSNWLFTLNYAVVLFMFGRYHFSKCVFYKGWFTDIQDCIFTRITVYIFLKNVMHLILMLIYFYFVALLLLCHFSASYPVTIEIVLFQISNSFSYLQQIISTWKSLLGSRKVVVVFQLTQ